MEGGRNGRDAGCLGRNAASSSASPMDALADLLRVLRFSSGLFLESRFRSPWCVRSQVRPEDCGQGSGTMVEMIGFHYILEGWIQLRLGSEPVRSAGPGQMILLAHNDIHLLGSDVSLPGVDARPLLRKANGEEVSRIDYGNGDRVLNHFVCGYLTMAAPRHPLLNALPPLLLADLRGRPCAEWAESSFCYAARGHAARRPGSREFLARLSELLFVEAVREYIQHLSADSTGWLAAMRDPALLRALSALHSRPAHRWSTEELAREACLSRSAFAERFSSTLGIPPMGYMTQWRMLLAGQRLRESSETIAQIATYVGYESESTFSRAFVREMGMAPGAWRKCRT